MKQLVSQVLAILKTEATVVDLQAPCKVFGDIHGQFTDLKKFFATYGEWLYKFSFEARPAQKFKVQRLRQVHQTIALGTSLCASMCSLETSWTAARAASKLSALCLR
jgi:hypothetical protein